MKSVSNATFFSTQVTEARRFYLDLIPSRKRPFTVVSGGVERCDRRYAMNRATFPYYGIEYVVRGRGEASINRKPYQLRPGNLFTYGPGVPHMITTDPKDPFVKYFVDFAGDGAGDLLKTTGLTAGTVSDVFPPDTLCALFDELIACGVGGRRGSPELCANLLECSLLKARSMKAPLNTHETVAYGKFQQYRNHVSANFIRLRSLEQVAAECYVSSTYLCHLFQRFEVQTPYRFLMRLKMSYAAEHIQNGALIKQVADMVGFNDPFHFSRVFRNTLGISPEKWRSMHRGLSKKAN